MTSNGQVSGASLGGLAKTSLREQALDQLRNAVTSGEIAPGTRLVETELSAALGISRGTLREALRQLQQEGLVEAGDRGRLTVRTLTDAEILDMFEVRAALEGLAAAIVSARPDRVALVAQLQIALDALEAARRVDQPHGRGRPGLPPAAVRTHREHHPGADLGGPGRVHPDVDHVRRHRQGAWRTCPCPVTSRSSTRSPPATRTPPGPRSTSTCAKPRRTCSTATRSNPAAPDRRAAARAVRGRTSAGRFGRAAGTRPRTSGRRRTPTLGALAYDRASGGSCRRAPPKYLHVDC